MSKATDVCCQDIWMIGKKKQNCINTFLYVTLPFKYGLIIKYTRAFVLDTETYGWYKNINPLTDFVCNFTLFK